MTMRDQADDRNGAALYRVLNSRPVPEFVKNAGSDDVYGTDLPNHVYADPVRRKFACHSPAATWVSAAFFQEHRTEVPAKLASWIESRIRSAADKFGVRREVAAVFAPVAKEASAPDSDFAIVVTYSDGSKERLYPLTSREAVKEAAEYLHRYRDEIPFRERRQMAERILDKAASLCAGLDGMVAFLEKQAGRGACAAADAAALLRNRAKALGRSDRPGAVQAKLAEMAELCAHKPDQVRDPVTMAKLAEAIDEIDRAHGLHREYGEHLPRPEDVLFAVTVKAASALVAEHCALSSGGVYKIADFGKVDLDGLRAVLGDEFAEAVSRDGMTVTPEKMAEIACTLPRPDAELMERLLSDFGVEKAASQLAAERAGPCLDDWKRLARLRGGA